MTVKQRIGTVKGVWAVPGISKNRRWYTPEMITGAVSEAQQAIDSGETLSMLTHHGARDPKGGDVTRTAARLTKVGLTPDGRATFEADIVDTQAGRDVAALVLPDNPFLQGVSMASFLTGNVRKVRGPDGEMCETADGLSLRGIDFTHNPGVDGAEITSAEAAESASGALVFESLEEVVFMEDASTEITAQTGPRPAFLALLEAASEHRFEDGQCSCATEATAETVYADSGYLGDNKKRFPIDTPEHIRSTWAAIGTKKVAESYTAPQSKRMRQRTKGAAKKFDIQIADETAALEAAITTIGADIADALEAYASVTLDNGPGTISVQGYTNEPEQLAAVGQRVALAALAGLLQLDPDNDGDIDLGIDGDDDAAECPNCESDVPEGALFCPTCGQAIPLAEAATNQKEAIVPSNTETNGAATESVTLTPDQLAELVANGAKAALEAAGVKPGATEVTESAELIAARKLITEADAAKTAAATESTTTEPLTMESVQALLAEQDTKHAEALESMRAAAVEEIRKAPGRRGLISKSVLEQSPEEVYGENADLRKLSTADLEKTADSVMYPLLAG